MKRIALLLILFVSFSVSAQEDRREIIEGEEYIIHTVKKGETLYGLTTKYKSSKKELRSSNSGMLLFLKLGQEIRIPVKDENKTIHKVGKGETLYGISKKYGVSIESLQELNPEKTKNLKEGDVLVLRKVAANVLVKVEEPIIEGPGMEDIQYTVKKGETLYGIARSFNTSVEKLKRMNPGLSESIKEGQIIIVPAVEKTIEVPVEISKPVVKETAKQIEYTVKKGETLYGISRKYNTTVEAIQKANPTITSLKEGDKIKINLPAGYQEEIQVVLGDPKTPINANFDSVNSINPLKDKLNEMVKKDTYTVSLFLPLMLDKNERIPQETGKPKKINPYTEMSVHFYQGAMIALDSAKKSGISLEVMVYDTENDTSTVGKYLRGSKVKSSDVIIGPFYEKPYSQVAQFSKANQIQAVSPVIRGNNKLLFNNMYVTKLQTSLPAQISYLSTYIANNKNTENVICVSSKSKQDAFLAKMFSEEYEDKIQGKSTNYRSKANEYKMTSFSSMHGLDEKLVKGKKNVIVLTLTEEGMSTAFFTQLNIMMTRSRMRGYEVEVYGLEDFLEYDIDINLKLKYNLHVTSSSFIDYKNEEVIKFIKNYRAKYGTEPSKYAFIGFDVAFYHALALSNYGANYTSYYDNVQIPLLQTSYVLKRTDNASGFENQAVFILAYKDFELVKVN